jgi:pimeloyl-ACP methyl ester carboxylesterase
LTGVLDQLAIERAHLVAHDFGGPWALVWAADHLDAVGSITLINTSGAYQSLRGQDLAHAGGGRILGVGRQREAYARNHAPSGSWATGSIR